MNGISIESLFQLPSDLIRQFDFTEDLKVALLSASDNLKGHQKRSFMSLTAHAFGPGGQRFVENELEWNRGTIRKGKHELKSNIICIDNFEGRGRKSAEEHLPHLLEDITSIVKPISQADPTFKSTNLYISITAESVYNRLIEEKNYMKDELPTIRTIGQKLNDLNFHPKLIKKCIPIKKIPETDLIFDEVHRINKFADCQEGYLRVSIDSKAKVKIGPFSRRGKNRQGQNACDHDFAPDYILSLFGIFLPLYDLTYFFFNKTKDPADFIVDCLQALWPVFKEAYNPHTLVLNLDNGPECNSHRSQFLKRIVEFAYTNNVNIILAYYPPYHSKYNPIERVWGVLERILGREILNTIEKALGLASSMKYNNVQAVVNFVEKEYFSGVKVNKKDLKQFESKIKRKPGLEKWFAEIIVRSTNTAEKKIDVTKKKMLA